jgi:hypothetical protein
MMIRACDDKGWFRFINLALVTDITFHDGQLTFLYNFYRPVDGEQYQLDFVGPEAIRLWDVLSSLDNARQLQ